MRHGRAGDNLPNDVRDLAAVSQILGYAKGETSLMVEEHRRRTRLARAVMDRTFWGVE